MPRAVTFLIAAFLILSAVPGMRAGPPPASDAAEKPPADARAVAHAFEARYRHASTLKAAFYERYSDGKGSGEAESGTVYFSRPGRMRWEYESPETKLFIVDGKSVWFYIPDDHTASRTKLKESSDWRTPIALLAGKADLAKICKNVEMVGLVNTDAPDVAPQARGGTRNEASVLRCTPRRSSDQMGEPITGVLLTINPEGYLVRVVIQQPGDLTTEFRFGKWQENIQIAESKFHFEPPPGVEIVDEEKLANQVY
jgi:outer membrane lipoprotein carrier protein